MKRLFSILLVLSLLLTVGALAGCKKDEAPKALDTSGWKEADLLPKTVTVLYDPDAVNVSKTGQGATLAAKDGSWQIIGASSLNTKESYDMQLSIAGDNMVGGGSREEKTLGAYSFTVFSREVNGKTGATCFVAFGDDAAVYGAMIVLEATGSTDAAEAVLSTLTVA